MECRSIGSYNHMASNLSYQMFIWIDFSLVDNMKTIINQNNRMA